MRADDGFQLFVLYPVLGTIGYIVGFVLWIRMLVHLH